MKSIRGARYVGESEPPRDGAVYIFETPCDDGDAIAFARCEGHPGDVWRFAVEMVEPGTAETVAGPISRWTEQHGSGDGLVFLAPWAIDGMCQIARDEGDPDGNWFAHSPAENTWYGPGCYCAPGSDDVAVMVDTEADFREAVGTEPTGRLAFAGCHLLDLEDRVDRKAYLWLAELLATVDGRMESWRPVGDHLGSGKLDDRTCMALVEPTRGGGRLHMVDIISTLKPPWWGDAPSVEPLFPDARRAAMRQLDRFVEANPAYARLGDGASLDRLVVALDGDRAYCHLETGGESRGLVEARDEMRAQRPTIAQTNIFGGGD